MTQVDFYILQNRPATAIYPFLCKLLEKGYKTGSRFLVTLSNETDANQLDTLLWTYSDTAFLPHQLILEPSTAPQDQKTDKDTLTSIPIILTLSHSEQYANQEQPRININLTDNIPEEITTFKRIIEIVPDETPWKSNSRVKYGKYQKLNAELKTHVIV